MYPINYALWIFDQNQMSGSPELRFITLFKRSANFDNQGDITQTEQWIK
jgi:hypothetical protein